METKALVVVAATLISSAGALHPESAHAAGVAGSAYGDSTVDASLDPGEERLSADGDKQARLKDLTDAFLIGYNARAREDVKPHTTASSDARHLPKPVVATPKRVVAQAEPPPLRKVASPIAEPRRINVVHVAPPRQMVAEVNPVATKRVVMKTAPAPAPAPQKRVYAQVEPVAPMKQVSMHIAPPKRAEIQVTPVKQAATRSTPIKLATLSAEPPILIPTRAVTSLPEPASDIDEHAHAATSSNASDGQRPVPRYRQVDQTAQARRYAAPESDESIDYSAAQDYAPASSRTAQAYQYAPAQYPRDQYQSAYAQPGYVPQPPAQTVARQVIVVARPPAYPAYPPYNPIYPAPGQRQPYSTGYGAPAQAAGYQGWE